MSSAAPKVRQSLFTVFFMLLVTVVFVAALSLVYVLTRDRIRLNESLVIKRAVLYAAGLSVPETPVAANDLFDKRVQEVKNSGAQVLYYRVLDPSGQLSGYVLPVTGRGLWGEIEAVIGVKPDLRTLTGIDFVRQNETPGLGARITEMWFREQFRGKQWPLSTVPEGNSTGPQQFQAITGATNTTNGVRDILNNRLAQAEKAIQDRQQ